MVYQVIYQRISLVLTALLLTSSLALSFNVQAAASDYDGIWDINFSCGSPRTRQRDFAMFRDVVVKNGQGSFADQGPKSKFSGTVSFRDGSIVIERRNALLSDGSVFWTLKVEGNLVDASTFNLIGVLKQFGTGTSLEDCMAGGVLRKPDSVSLANTKPVSSKPKATASATASLLEYDGRWKFSIDCVASQGEIAPHKFELDVVDGEGSISWKRETPAPRLLEYKVTIQNNKFLFIRTNTNTLDPTQAWQMKVAGEMMSKTRLQTKGLINGLYREAGASECMVTGYR